MIFNTIEWYMKSGNEPRMPIVHPQEENGGDCHEGGQKTYDYVDWNFLHLILSKIGLTMYNIEQIMAYVTSVQFVVLINDIPLIFLVSVGLYDRVSLCRAYFLFFSWMESVIRFERQGPLVFFVA